MAIVVTRNELIFHVLLHLQAHPKRDHTNALGSQTLPADPLRSQDLLQIRLLLYPHPIASVSEFPLSKLPVHHGHPKWFWFNPHRGFGLRYIIRFLVAGVWILDTLHFSFMCHFLYYYLITNYGNPTSFLYTLWSLQASVLVHVIMVTMIQCFFVHQIYHLCRPQVKWWVTGPIMLFVLAATGLGMASGIVEYSNSSNHANRNSANPHS
ncbi:hypothetical protein EDD15DRAFT_1458240 [Pisolithus albus]|nr:hypothetical protein EDD15DRAFT_1458240 [Pisolithus albus]